jgi:prephenate dehydrogenase
MRIAFLGLGLIGGSVALALRAHAGPEGHRLVAWSPGGRGPQEALAAGTIDETAPDAAAAVAGSDLVVLAAPPLATISLVDLLGSSAAGTLSPAATVTDVASTKGAIVARADAAGLAFVGGHPMAGRETSGYGAATADLFSGRPWVVVPGRHARMSDVERVEALALACGALSVTMGAAAHDAATAAISHAPLVVAAALVEAMAGAPGSHAPDGWDVARRLAASGWRDMTRLARGDAEMGAGILATNGPATANHLRAVRARLDAWIASLEAEGGVDADAIRRALAADRTRAADPDPDPDRT